MKIIGDTVTPKEFPTLKGKIVRIDKGDEGTLYVLESGARFLKSELL